MNAEIISDRKKRFKVTQRRRENPAPFWIAFALSGLVMLYGIFSLGMPIAQAGSRDRLYRDIFLAAVALLTIVCRLIGIRDSRPASRDRLLNIAAIALPCYVLFQVTPLPLWLDRILSPARVELVEALRPLYGDYKWAALSIAPGKTAIHFLLICAYACLFFVARTLTRKSGAKVWFLVLPLVIAALLESALAFAQLTDADGAQIRGTYGVRNHLAGLLEMVLPFAVLYGLSTLDAIRRGNEHGSAPALRVLLAFGASGMMLAAAFATLSRGGFAALLTATLVVSALLLSGQASLRKRIAGMAGLFVVAAAALFFAAPAALVERFGEHSSSGRLTIWKEALGVLKEFPVFGCGMGGFESAFLKFKVAEGLVNVDYAHNDYLQLFAELGAVGFLIGAVFIISVFVRALRNSSAHSDVRWLALACTAAISAILAHSFLDFNLYVAANAAVFAWICGIAAGLRSSTD